MSLDSFKEIFAGMFKRSGGRRPFEKNQEALDRDESTWMAPCKEGQARLTIVQITDVYTLDNFAALKTLLQTIRQAQGSDETSNRVVSMLTGDFLAPYLLSSVDRGAGMMKAINETPIDILTWGNHEADIDHRTVCRHIKDFQGTFINTNMQSHAAMEHQVPYEVLHVASPDGSQVRKVGLVGVLSNDPKLYSHFKSPGAFGGAKIDDPWESLRKYKRLLEEDEGCDVVVPLEHLYVPENIKTCEQFDFPVILSGHDHHRIDQIISGTRLIKPGMDGDYATVLEIVWHSADDDKPVIRSTFVPTESYSPCPILKKKTDGAYDVLLPLRNTMLASILPAFRPLSSKNARGSVCTMGKLICTMLKASLVQTREAKDAVHAVMLMGGNIRGNETYDESAFFSLETLEAEIKSDEVVAVVDMPGSILAAGIEATHAGPPIPGWFQHDDGVKLEDGKVVTVAGEPSDVDRIYRVATKIKDLTNGQSPPLTTYYKEHPELLPAKGSYINIHHELMGFFSRAMFRKLGDATGELIPDVEEVAEDYSHPVNLDEIEGRLRLDVLDRDNDGIVTVDDIHEGLRKFLGLTVDDNEKSLAEQVHSYADVTDNGVLTVEDFEFFCTGLPRELRLQKKWHKAFPGPSLSMSREGDDAAIEGRDVDAEASNMKRNDTEVTFPLSEDVDK